MLNYKRLGIKNFKKSKFDDAAMFFSLAYEKNKDEDLLFYINLSALAKQNEDEAKALFEFFYEKDKQDLDTSNLEEVLEFLESKESYQEGIDEQNAISYEDFMQMVSQSNFKNVFEDIMFSTKVMISTKEDFLEFIQNLIKNDFLEMGMTYLESAATMFGGDEKIENLIKQIQKRQDNENLH